VCVHTSTHTHTHTPYAQIPKSVLKLAEKAAAEMRKDGDVARPQHVHSEVAAKVAAEAVDKDHGEVSQNLIRLAQQAASEQSDHSESNTGMIADKASKLQQAPAKLDILQQAEQEQKEDELLTNTRHSQNDSDSDSTE
jgi:hypothetical protein